MNAFPPTSACRFDGFSFITSTGDEPEHHACSPDGKRQLARSRLPLDTNVSNVSDSPAPTNYVSVPSFPPLKQTNSFSSFDFGFRVRRGPAPKGRSPSRGRGRSCVQVTHYTSHPTPYTLHSTPFTLHPTPYILHPTLYLLREDGVHLAVAEDLNGHFLLVARQEFRFSDFGFWV